MTHTHKQNADDNKQLPSLQHNDAISKFPLLCGGQSSAFPVQRLKRPVQFRGSRLNPDPVAIRALIRPDPTLPALLRTRLTSAPGSVAYILLLCGPRTQIHLWPTSKDRAQGKHLSPLLSKYDHLAYQNHCKHKGMLQ